MSALSPGIRVAFTAFTAFTGRRMKPTSVPRYVGSSPRCSSSTLQPSHVAHAPRWGIGVRIRDPGLWPLFLHHTGIPPLLPTPPTPPHSYIPSGRLVVTRTPSSPPIRPQLPEKKKRYRRGRRGRSVVWETSGVGSGGVGVVRKTWAGTLLASVSKLSSRPSRSLILALSGKKRASPSPSKIRAN